MCSFSFSRGSISNGSYILKKSNGKIYILKTFNATIFNALGGEVRKGGVLGSLLMGRRVGKTGRDAVGT